MRLLMISVICLVLLFGITRPGYCPGGSYGGGGYKGTGSYYDQGRYKVDGPIQNKAGEPIIDKTNQPSYSPTLGQELIDLDAAYKKGIITDEEYSRLKNIIIDRKTGKAN